jgi:hypothetical protein
LVLALSTSGGEKRQRHGVTLPVISAPAIRFH